MVEEGSTPPSADQTNQENDGFWAKIRKNMGIKPVYQPDAQDKEDSSTLDHPTSSQKKGIQAADKVIKKQSGGK